MCVFIHVTKHTYVCKSVYMWVIMMCAHLYTHMNVGKYVCSKGLLPKSPECLFLSKAM